MNYTQEEFQNAIVISGADYENLENPVFEGQTRVDKNGNYSMYWSSNGKLYCTKGIL